MSFKEITRKWLGVEWGKPYRGHILWMWFMSITFALGAAAIIVGAVMTLFR
jgi:hypothetical protein